MIAFIGAMDEEVVELKNMMENPVEKTVSGQRFIEGTLSGKDCVLLQSGIGKCAAAMVTTILMENYHPEGVVNIGTAGGLYNDEEPLDVVVSTRVAFHDFSLAELGWGRDFDEERLVFNADLHYVETMQKIADDQEHKIWFGDIVSGDMFVSQEKVVNFLHGNYPTALCSDMEAAAVGMVCANYGVPFVVIRAISDITTKPDNEKHFSYDLSKAAHRSAVWCRKFIENL